MGIKDWFARRSAERGKENLLSALANLIPIADEAFSETAALRDSGQPTPPPSDRIRRHQDELLNVLTVGKGMLSDQDAMRIISDVISSRMVGIGGRMAVKEVVLDMWPSNGDPWLAAEQKEGFVGSHEEEQMLIAAARKSVDELATLPPLEILRDRAMFLDMHLRGGGALRGTAGLAGDCHAHMRQIVAAFKRIEADVASGQCPAAMLKDAQDIADPVSNLYMDAIQARR